MGIIVTASLLLALPASANEDRAGEVAINLDKNWKVIKHGDNQPTRFTVDDNVLRLRSKQSVAFYTHRLPRLSRISHCEWQLDFEWRVLSAEGLSSQREKGLDDRPLALHVWVNDASQFGWLKGGLAKLFSIPTPGYMLTYSWGLDEEWQSAFENPHLPKRSQIRVLRKASEIGPRWYKESINLSAALAALGNKNLIDKRLYLAISADTEDNGGAALSELRNLRLWHRLCAKPKP